MAEKLMSLNPRDAIHYAFLDNTDGTIVNAYTTIFQDDNYNDGNPVVGFNIVVDTEDGHDPVNKFFKMGSTQAIAPNEDKTGFKAVGQNVKGFSDKCAGMYFLTSLLNCQYPEDALEDEVDIKKMLIGLRAHFESEEVVSGNKNLGKDGKFSYTIVTKIYELPDHIKGGKKTTTKSGSKKSSAKTATTSDMSKDDLDAFAAKWLRDTVNADNFLVRFPDGYIGKTKLAPQLMNDADYEPNQELRQSAAMRVFKPDLLRTNAGWSFNEDEQKIYPGD